MDLRQTHAPGWAGAAATTEYIIGSWLEAPARHRRSQAPGRGGGAAETGVVQESAYSYVRGARFVPTIVMRRAGGVSQRDGCHGLRKCVTRAMTCTRRRVHCVGRDQAVQSPLPYHRWSWKECPRRMNCSI